MRIYCTIIFVVGLLLSAFSPEAAQDWYRPILEVSASTTTVPRGEAFSYTVRISDPVTPEPYRIDVGIGTPVGLAPGPITLPSPAYCTIPSSAVVTCHALTLSVTQTVTLSGSIFVTGNAPLGDTDINIVIPGYGVRQTVRLTIEPAIPHPIVEPTRPPEPADPLPEHHTLYLPALEQHREMNAMAATPQALLMPPPAGYVIESTWPVTDGAALRLFQVGDTPGAAIAEETIWRPADPSAAYDRLIDRLAASGGADFSFIAGSFGDATTARWRYVEYQGFLAVELLYAIRAGPYVLLVDVIGDHDYLDQTGGAEWAALAMGPFY